MRNFFAYSAAALLFVLGNSGCTKKTSPPSYSMSATVAGAPYTSALCIAYTSGNNVEIEAETTTAGATLTYPYISLWLNRTSLTTGTFSLDSTQLNNYAEYITSVSTFKLAKSGSITITSISPDVVGTFSFTCTDSTVVTNGKFVAESL